MAQTTAKLNTPGQVANEVAGLKAMWTTRNAKMPNWYDILLMKDELKQEGMESFVTNDPRTFYNLSLHLLTPDVIPHRIKEESESAAVTSKYDSINRFLDSCWDRLDRGSRRRGRQSWLRRLVGLTITTGWYSVIAIADKDKVMAEVWHPYQVYPEFGDTEDDLLRCAHEYTITPRAAMRKLAAHPDWAQNLRLPTQGQPVTVLDYWAMEADGAWNVVVINNQIAKAYVKTPFTTIPILTGPAGGLPDDGVIQSGTVWQEHYGESILATNEQVYKSYNRQMTFLQQLLRDTAQPMIKEKSKGSKIVENTDDLFKRGALFRMEPDENLERMDMGAVPVDVRTTLFDIGNMMQRGSLPAALFGNVQQQIAAYLMSQIASSAHQVLDDYRDAVRGVLQDVDKLWLTQMRDQNLSPYTYKLPTELPEEFEVSVGLEISIPGDLVQRVSTARVANPNFKISSHTLISLLFPEVRDPLAEQAMANAEQALQGQIAQTLATIKAFRDESIRLRDAGDSASAQIYEAAAQKLESQVGGQQSGAATAPAPGAPGEPIPREMLPGGG